MKEKKQSMIPKGIKLIIYLVLITLAGMVDIRIATPIALILILVEIMDIQFYN